MQTTRTAALHAVERYYYTGKPCKYGHVSKRITRSGACMACVTERITTEARDFARRLREKEAKATV